jgi:hypothetical protein
LIHFVRHTFFFECGRTMQPASAFRRLAGSAPTTGSGSLLGRMVDIGRRLVSGTLTYAANVRSAWQLGRRARQPGAELTVAEELFLLQHARDTRFVFLESVHADSGSMPAERGASVGA